MRELADCEEAGRNGVWARSGVLPFISCESACIRGSYFKHWWRHDFGGRYVADDRQGPLARPKLSSPYCTTASYLELVPPEGGETLAQNLLGIPRHAAHDHRAPAHGRQHLPLVSCLLPGAAGQRRSGVKRALRDRAGTALERRGGSMQEPQSKHEEAEKEKKGGFSCVIPSTSAAGMTSRVHSSVTLGDIPC
jgi:hypothetical protein